MVNFEMQWKAPTNEHGEDYQWTLMPCQPFLDAQGNVESLFGVLIDIQEQKRTERQRKVLEKRLSDFTDHSVNGVAMTDANMKIIYANDAWFKLVGAARVPYEEFSWEPFLYPDDFDAVMAGHSKLEAGEVVNAEFRINKVWTAGDGSTSLTWISATCVPEMDEQGNLVQSCDPPNFSVLLQIADSLG